MTSLEIQDEAVVDFGIYHRRSFFDDFTDSSVIETVPDWSDKDSIYDSEYEHVTYDNCFHSNNHSTKKQAPLFFSDDSFSSVEEVRGDWPVVLIVPYKESHVVSISIDGLLTDNVDRTVADNNVIVIEKKNKCGHSKESDFVKLNESCSSPSSDLCQKGHARVSEFVSDGVENPYPVITIEPVNDDSMYLSFGDIEPSNFHWTAVRIGENGFLHPVKPDSVSYDAVNNLPECVGSDEFVDVEYVSDLEHENGALGSIIKQEFPCLSASSSSKHVSIIGSPSLTLTEPLTSSDASASFRRFGACNVSTLDETCHFPEEGESSDIEVDVEAVNEDDSDNSTIRNHLLEHRAVASCKELQSFISIIHNYCLPPSSTDDALPRTTRYNHNRNHNMSSLSLHQHGSSGGGTKKTSRRIIGQHVTKMKLKKQRKVPWSDDEFDRYESVGRRNTHNLNERMRRKQLSLDFCRLKEVIPSVSDNPSKNLILRHAVKVIRQLQKQSSAGMYQLNDLMREHRRLQQLCRSHRC